MIVFPSAGELATSLRHLVVQLSHPFDVLTYHRARLMVWAMIEDYLT